MAMPTDSDLAPSACEGVCVSTVATMSMQQAIPRPPTMNKTLRPQRSTTQVTLKQKIMEQVALRALMSAIVEEELKTFW